jgi:hypothetical protein
MAILFPAYIGAAVASKKYTRTKIIAMCLGAKVKAEISLI